MKIRVATLKDASAIQQINANSLHYDFPLDQTTLQLEKILSLPNSQLLVATENKHVLGYIQLSDYENTYHESLKNIITLAVDQNYQHQGVGSKLLAAAETWAKDNGSQGIRLVTGFERKTAHPFYEKHGYQIRKRELNYIKWWD